MDHLASASIIAVDSDRCGGRLCLLKIAVPLASSSGGQLVPSPPRPSGGGSQSGMPDHEPGPLIWSKGCIVYLLDLLKPSPAAATSAPLGSSASAVDGSGSGHLASMLGPLKSILEDKEVVKVFHNAAEVSWWRLVE